MKQLLNRLREQEIFVLLDNDKLRIKFNGEKLPDTVLNEIKNRKEEIISYLRQQVTNEPAQFQIQPVHLTNGYPLSSAQRRIWVLCHFNEGRQAYNTAEFYEFEGQINLEALNRAINLLAEKHEILRTVFLEDETGEIKQFILPIEKEWLKITINDFRNDHNQNEKLNEILKKEAEHSFEFSRGPLLRCSLSRLSEDKYIFSFVIHHIISDGWSLNIMMKELFFFYSALVKHQQVAETPLRIQYKDYAVWQQQQLTEDKFIGQKQYWINRFSGQIPALNIPSDFSRPEIKTFKGEVYQETIPPHLVASLKTLCQKNGGTLFMGLFSAVTTLLHLRSKQTDIIIGTPVAGRNNTELEDQVGVYLNTLALRINPVSSDTLNSILQKAKVTALNAFKNQDYPFDHLIKDLNLTRDTGRNALFDVTVILQNTNITGNNQSEHAFSGIKARPHPYHQGSFSKTDLSFDFTETGQELQLKLEYSTDLFRRETITGFIQDLKMILSPENYTVALSELPVSDRKLIAETENPVSGFWTVYTNSIRNKLLPFEKNPAKENASYKLKKRTLTANELLKTDPKVSASAKSFSYEIIHSAAWVHVLQRTCNVQEVTFGLSENKDAAITGKREFTPIVTDISPELTINTFLTELSGRLSYIRKFGTDELRKAASEMNTGTEAHSLSALCFVTTPENNSPSGRFPLELIINTVTNETSLHYCSNSFTEEEVNYLIELYITGVNKLNQADGNSVVHNLFSAFCSYDDVPSQKQRDTSYNSIIQLFKQEVIAHPEQIALIYHQASFSYKELDQMSDHLAAMLQDTYGISSGDKIALDLPRNEWLPVSILGILKIGAVYLPLSPDLPARRKEFIIADSQSKLILTNTEIQHIRSRYTTETHAVSYASISKINVANIYYTSGTTGKPKGVKVTHGNLLNFFDNIKTDFRLKRGDRMVAATGLTFDISGFEILGTLCNGIQLIMAGDEEVADPHKLLQYVREQHVNIFQLTPSRLQQLFNLEENLDFLSVLLVGGEALPQHLYEKLKAMKNTEVINVYGPTETTIWSTMARLKSTSELCIGHALSGEEIILLDRWNRKSIRGIKGEISIGGLGVTAGYIGNNDLNTSKFIPHPDNANETIYLTGDLGQWNAKHELLFKGRKDTQVKINGRRIELEEIENTLYKAADINLCAVCLNSTNENQKIVAFYTAQSTIEKEKTEAVLSEYIPHYMIPSHFIKLSEMPVTPSGKIDRVKLANWKLEELTDARDLDEAATETEKILVDAYRFVLAKKEVGTSSDFFYLGGDSIKAIQLITRIKKEGLSVELAHIMRNPRIKDLARYVVRTKKISDQRTVTGVVPLTPIQKYFFEGDAVDMHHYNHSIMLDYPEHLNKEFVEEILSELTRHHDALRMQFVHENEAWQQHNPPFITKPQLSVSDLSSFSHEEGIEKAYKEANELQSKLDLKAGNLLLAGIFRLKKGSKLLFAIHHLVVDGISWRIVLEDFVTLYNQKLNNEKFSLPLKSESFLSWSKKLGEASQDPKLISKEKKYWQRIEELATNTDSVNYPASNLQGKKQLVTLALDTELSEAVLGDNHAVYGTTVNDFLITAIGLAWNKLFGGETWSLAMESHGRGPLLGEFDTTRTVGWLTSLYPLNFPLNCQVSLSDNLKAVRNILKSVPNLGVGYGILKYLSSGTGLLSKNSFRDNYPVIFNYLGQFDKQLGDSPFEIDEQYNPEIISPRRQRDHQVEIVGIHIAKRINIAIHFNPEAFTTEKINELLCLSRDFLSQIVNLCANADRASVIRENFTYKNIFPEKVTRLDRESSIEDIYPLTPMQSGIYFHYKLNPGSTTYFQQVSYKVKGRLNVETAKQSLEYLFKRYPAIRCLFVEDIAEHPVQVIFKEMEPVLNYEKFTKAKHTDPNSFIASFKEADRKRSFNISSDPLLRLAILQIDEENYELIWSNHHILMDGWCVGILSSEFMTFYNSIEQGTEPELQPVPDYTEYLKWLEGLSHDKFSDYWRNLLHDVNSETAITPWHNKINNNIYSLDKYKFRINAPLTGKLVHMAQTRSVTLNAVLQSAWGLLLARYNASSDVVFGAVVSGRPPEIKNIDRAIGLFINTIPVRIKITDGNFSQLLREVHEQSISGKPYHYGQLAEIQNFSPVKSNLINHIFLFENFPLSKQVEEMGLEAASALRFSDIEIFDETSYDFNIIVFPGNEIEIEFTYNQNKYGTEQIKTIASHLTRIFEQVSDNPETSLTAISLLTEPEENLLLNHFGGLTEKIPQTAIPHLIYAKTKTLKDKTAILSGNRKLSYSELWHLCGSIAVNLEKKFNIKSGDTIAVKLSRNEHLVPCLLSLMAMNVTYVPIDAHYPAERIEYIVNDCQATLLIDDVLLKELIHFNTATVEFKPSTEIKSLAYILYTSGSTGKPKGVKVTHENLVNFVMAMNKELPASYKSHILAVTSISFDISFLELIWPLTNGMTITIKEDATKLTDFNEFLNEESKKQLDFGLFFFASYQNHNPKDSRYKLFLETSVYADRNGYSAIWTPERHFHDFGGLFADSSITSAALSQITKNIELRSGSCVIPLHDTVRVAEQWSMIDNLSDGRISISLATGWNANDFIFYPERYDKRKEVFYSQIKELQHLWSGGTVQRKNGIGKTIEVQMFPQPVQSTLPIWITSSGNPETFKEAGEGGFHLLTHLLGQSLDILEKNLKIYFDALDKNGHDRSNVKVALMLHTYVGENINDVKELVRVPFKNYLASSLGLLHNLAKGLNIDMTGENLDQYKEELLEMGFERYWNTSALLGTHETCTELLKKIASIGVTEIACLVDFGLNERDVMEGLKRLDALKDDFSKAKQKNSTKESIPEKIDFLQSTPSLLKLMTDDKNSHRFLKSLNTIVAGGEALPVSLLKKIREISNATVYNVYGPTETTIWSTVKHLTDENVTVGKPVLNTEVYILDKKMNLIPIGIKGDVYIGGKGVASGYFGREELTREKFVNVSLKNKKLHLYKTGDLGYWLPNGELQISGREDNQIKLNGNRIELEEIEIKLTNCTGVKSAAVMVNKSDIADTLTAYLVCEKQTNIGKIRSELSSMLPSSWIPSSYMKVAAIPLTPNGKTDRHALKFLTGEKPVSEDTGSVPTNQIESTLQNIWQSVMHRQTAPGIHQNIFEAGANSIIATQANYKIYRELFVKLKLRDLFDNPTIASQAALILVSEENIYKKIERIPDAEAHTASHAQKRMWLLNEIPDSRITLTESLVINLKSSFNQEIFDRAANAVISRHEVLRTSVSMEGDEVMQRVKAPEEYVFRSSYIDCRDRNMDKAALQQLILEAINVPFNLSKDILFRFLVAETGSEDYKIIFTNHHIISDDWSKNILIKELFENYHQMLNGKKPNSESLRIHYRDFANWQNNYLNSNEGLAHKNYWTTKFKTPPPFINLTPETSFAEHAPVWAKEFEFSIEKELMNEVIRLGTKISGTTFMVLMSAYKTLLYCVSGETDIVVGMPTAGRTHPDLESQIGFYLNLLPVRSFIDPHLSFETIALQEKEILLTAHEHQFFPFDLLVNSLNYKPNPGKHPLFDIGITYHNLDYFFHETYKKIELIEVDEVTAATDLWFHVYNRPDSLYCKFVYRSALYSSTVITEFTEFLIHILKRVTASPEISPYEMKQELTQIRNLRVQNNKLKRLSKLREKKSHI